MITVVKERTMFNVRIMGAGGGVKINHGGANSVSIYNLTSLATVLGFNIFFDGPVKFVRRRIKVENSVV